MRVIAGSAKGRRLEAPRGQLVRPTADRVKEALFSMLGSRVDLAGAVLLDVFAGSGALGIEALSRGAAAVTFIEQEPAARRALGANLERCGMSGRGRIVGQSAQAALARLAGEGATFDGVLMDPPYGHELADRSLTVLAGGPLLRPGSWVAAEHHADDRLAESYGNLQLTTAKRYGKTVVSLYRNAQHPDDVAET
ncbi:MAG TPA: 16S rRNA (guanine(966)-N(2))-methyltransferase RsmD [Candidatus Dormibacteraeota bacterium]|nr:16S rRNA (guanine(966)-N(2))-methyltransferase RsmD [Candidatus Dormibacteraeota bacterium]